MSRLYEANAAALSFFVEQLKASAPACDYLAGRGLTEPTIRQFSLGFAPDAWSDLSDRLRRTGFTDAELIAAGLARKREKSQGVYDTFRNRIIFPIHDDRGRVAAFGGRILGDGKPKYLNSPETPVYSKGRLLFNLHRIPASQDPGAGLVLVEGYMDVVGLAQGGVTHAVATLGTSLTEPQIRKVARLARTLYLAYDPDEAGVRATLRSLELLESSGLTVKVLGLPDGVDPDELVIGKGREAWDAVIAAAQEVEDFLFDHTVRSYDLGSLAQKREAFRELQRVFGFLPSATGRERFLRRVAERLQLGDDVVRSSFTERRRRALSDDVLAGTGGLAAAGGAGPASRPKPVTPVARSERFVLACFLAEPSLYDRFRGQLAGEDLEDALVGRVLPLLDGLPRREGPVADRLMGQLPDDELKRFVAELSMDFVLPEGSGDHAVGECLRQLARQRLERRKTFLAEQLKACQEPGERARLLAEQMRVIRAASR
jgi:DNA primase